MSKQIHIIGGGLAGSECAYSLAQSGHKVTLYEQRGVKPTFAHITTDFAELVCSNSFRSDDDTGNAVGLLHHEMRQLGSVVMRAADKFSVPAGSALAVDRDGYSGFVTNEIENHPNITVIRKEITSIPRESDDIWIIATGPQTDGALALDIADLTGQEHLAFFDAIAPIIYTESIDMSKAWSQSRYDKGETEEEQKAYINCPMTKDQYEAFIDALMSSEKTEFHDWEKDTPYFDGCLPIEIMAERGRETLRFGPMKPVGLTNPHSDEKPYAVVQLRQDNQLKTLYNIVGFQTKMKYGAQKDVLRMIPGLENSEFARLGGIHRNCFIHSPSLLNADMSMKSHPHIHFAGQITGVEGYVESASMGLLLGTILGQKLVGNDISPPNISTAMGALIHHITGGAEAKTFQPMNVNFGLFPPIDAKGGRKGRKERYAAYCARGKEEFAQWKNF